LSRRLGIKDLSKNTKERISLIPGEGKKNVLGASKRGGELIDRKEAQIVCEINS